MTKKDSVLAGIDEAGLGPLLGPLVVGKSVFKLDREKYTGKIPNLWVVFKQLISKDKKATDKIVITDSKKLHKPGKIVALEETVLSVLHSINDVEKRLSVLDFLNLVCEKDEIDRILKQPWFEDLSMLLPLEASSDLCKHRGHRLQNVFEDTGVKLAVLRAQIVTAHLFNGLIDKYQNKSYAHWAVVVSLIKEVLTHDLESTIIVDKQGGRDFYGEMLRQSMPDASISAHFEGKTITSHSEKPTDPEKERKFSDYYIENSSGKHKIAFVSQGEDYSLPVALGSCVAKYVREVLMHVFNKYFRDKYPDLKPTKGYYTDGMRFLRDLTKLGYPIEKYRDFLVRKR